MEHHPPYADRVCGMDRCIGGLTILTVVVVWLMSTISPFLFLYGMVFGHHALVLFIALVTIVAYVPWDSKVSNYLPGSVQRIFRHYAPRYYQQVQVVFDNESKQTTRTNNTPVSTGQTFYAIHPHGAFCMGWGILFLDQAWECVRFCFSPYLYQSPLFRLLSRCTGRPGSASKQNMRSYLREGQSVALLPGGFEEATITCLHQDRVYLRHRTGFIRLCLGGGVPVRPVFVFGEKDCYWNIPGGWKWRLALNRYGLPTILAWGCWWLPLLPKPNVALYIAVGEPLILPEIDNPSKDQVQQWHDKYVAALIKLYETHKEHAYGASKAKTMKLEVW
jgi:hypothetical protein